MAFFALAGSAWAGNWQVLDAFFDVGPFQGPARVTAGQNSSLVFSIRNTSETTLYVTRMRVDHGDGTSQDLDISNASGATQPNSGRGNFTITHAWASGFYGGGNVIKLTISSCLDPTCTACSLLPVFCVADETLEARALYATPFVSSLAFSSTPITSSVIHRGDEFTASWTVRNDTSGNGTTRVECTPSLSFSGISVNSTPGSALSIEIGASRTFNFGCRVPTNSPGGSFVPNLSITAAVTNRTDSGHYDGGITVSLTNSPVHVLRPAQLRINSISSPVTQVYRGLKNVPVTMTVQNTGEVAADVDLAFTFLTFNGAQEGYTQRLVSGPALIAAGGTGTYKFEVDVEAEALVSTNIIDGTITATDDYDGGIADDLTATTTDSWTVLIPARLNIDRVETAIREVTQGQSNVPVTLSVTNLGQVTANVDLAGTGLLFDGSTAGYAVTTAGPLTLAGGTSATYSLSVDVETTAPLGPTSIDATIAATDFGYGADAGDDDGSDITATWTALTPAEPRVRAIVRSSANVDVTQGQTGLTLQMSVENTGQTTASVALAGTEILFDGASTGYVSTVSGPVALQGGESATYSFAVSLNSDAPPGPTSLDGTIAATDVNTGKDVSDTGADSPSAWRVLTPAQIIIDSTTPSASRVTQGQTGLTVTMSTRNIGGTTAAVDLSGTGLNFVGDRAGFGVTGAGPARIPGGTSALYTFGISVLPGALPGPRAIHGFTRATDIHLGARADRTGTLSPGSWTVLTPAALAIRAVSTESREVTPGLSGVRVTLTVENTGETAATLDPALLKLTAANVEWTPRSGGSSPPPRSAHALAYDSARKRIVLFGGRGALSQKLGDTWEWDGAAWRAFTPASAPAARFGHVLAFDSDRARTVLFGGTDGSAVFTDTWEWNGAVWSLRASSPPPAGRQFAGLVHDPASRHAVQLFGGADRFGQPLADGVFEWNGTAWSGFAPSAPPPARVGGAMAFDRPRARVVLFGGLGLSGTLGDTWELGPDGWSNVSPATAPEARRFHAMAADAARGVTVLFGGVPDSLPAISLPDTWEWNGSTWTSRFRPPTLEQRGPSSPGSRSAHALAYDSARRQTVLFGGLAAFPTGERSYTIGQPIESEDVDKLAVAETWELGRRDLASVYAIVPRLTNPARIAGLSTVTFEYDLTVDLAAPAGPVILDGEIRGIDDVLRRTIGDTGADVTATWNALVPVKLAIGRIGPVPAVVQQGQSGIQVTMAISNSGASTATMDLARTGLTFNGDTRGYSVSVQGPAEIGGFTTAVYTFVVDVAGDAPAGPTLIDGFAAATDAATGAQAEARGAARVRSWLTFAPARLAIRQVRTGAPVVTRGQTAVPVTVSVENLGSVTAVIDLARSGLTFSGSSSGYSISTAGPDSISGAETALLTFTVDVGANAPLGGTVVDAFVSATDADTTSAAGDAGADSPGAWTVLTPATISIRSLSAPTDRVSRGQGEIPVTLSIGNDGQATAVVDLGRAGLLFGGSAQGYVVTTTGPSTIPGLSEATYLFEVFVSSTAPLGLTNLQGVVEALDEPSGRPAGVRGGSDSWTVETPARLVLSSVTSNASVVRGGESGRTLSWTVTNTGQAGASLSSVTPTFLPATLDWTALDASGPPPRQLHALAEDALRGRVVLFGGADGASRLGDTWEWDGTAWRQASPATAPAARSSHAMAYDARRGRVVLFGGSGSEGRLSDTWEWDGSAWIGSAPAIAPTSRSGHAMAYDARRGVVVLFGGTDGTSRLDDTWEWDGAAWRRRVLETAPPARSSHSLAADLARGRLVLFGGSDGANRLGDTWEWDGRSWSELSPAQAPSARVLTAMAYSHERGRIVLEGGLDSESIVRSDTWEWDGFDWVDRSSSVRPPARQGAAMARDPGGRRLLLFGGQDPEAKRLGDTWALASSSAGRGFTVRPVAGNPVALAGGETATFGFEVDVDTAVTPGLYGLEGVLFATDGNSGLPAGTTRAASAAAWTVHPAPAAVAIRSVATPRSAVRRGQSALPVFVSLANTGGTPASLDLTRTGLTFNGAVAGFSVTTQAPQSLAAGATALCTFLVSALDTAGLGSTTIDAVVTASDAISGVSAGARGSAVTTIWTVGERAPAAVAIRDVQGPASFVRGQQQVPFSMTIENTGTNEARLDLARTGLTFNGASTGYGFIASGPASLAGGRAAVLSILVSSATTVPFGPSTVDGFVAASDASTGVLAGSRGAARTAQCVVLRQTTLRILAVTPQVTQAVEGEIGVAVTMSVQNIGQSTGLLDLNRTGLTLSSAVFNRPRTKGPSSIAPSQVVTFSFNLEVLPRAPTGPAPIDGFATARDAITGQTVFHRGAERRGAIRILAPASLAANVTLESPVIAVSSGRVPFVVTVSNSGESTAVLSLDDVVAVASSSRFVASAAGPSRVGPGQSAAFGLTLAFAPGIAPGLYSGLGGDVLYADVALGKPVGLMRVALPPFQIGKAAIRIAGVEPENSEVTAGQTGARVLVNVVNAGQLPARIDLAGSRLSFNGAQTGFTQSVLGPLRLEAGEQAAYVFTVAVSPSASPGAVTLDAGIAATDELSGQPAGAARSEQTGAWTVKRPARLEILSVAVGQSAVARGDRDLQGQMSVRNAGETEAIVDLAGTLLTFGGSSAGYVAVASGAGRIAPGSTESYSFTIAVGASAPLGSTAIDGVVTATDARLGTSVSTSGAASKTSWTVSGAPAGQSLPRAVAAPVAATGRPRSVTLDGSGSAPGSGGLRYRWSLISRPAGSASFESTAATTAFRAIARGAYTFRLAVTDSSQRSDSTLVSFAVQNVAPTVSLGQKQDIVLARPGLPATFQTTLGIRLDAAAAADANGDALTYAWRIARAPRPFDRNPDSTPLVSLTGRDAPRPVAIFSTALATASGASPAPLLAAGAYAFSVTVGDGIETTTATMDVRVIDPLNLLPVADPGLDRRIRVTFEGVSPRPTIPDALRPPPDNFFSYFRLDGRASRSPTGEALTFRWRTLLSPAGDPAVLTGPDTPTPRLIPRKVGKYVFELTVNTARYDSNPEDVTVEIDAGNRRPNAQFLVRNKTETRVGTLFNAVQTFTARDRIFLDAGRATDPDVADRPNLLYQWILEDAPPGGGYDINDLTARVAEFTGKPGSYLVALRVEDPAGNEDIREIAFHIAGPGTGIAAKGEQPLADQIVSDQTPPALTLVSSATTTSQRGEDLPEGIAPGAVSSLRVTAPSTVTLSFFMTAATTPGQRFDYVWRQLAGPLVLMTSRGETNTPATEGRTSFEVTTSGVLVFELAASRVDATGLPTGFTQRRKLRVVADSQDATVPVALASSSAPTVPATGTEAQRTVTLDAGATSLPPNSAGAAKTLSYQWRQIAGPAVELENDTAAVTRFSAPEFAGTTQEIPYVFELTALAEPPALRSEPVYVTVVQVPRAASPGPGPDPVPLASGVGGGGGGGGGCALARSPDGQSRELPWLVIAAAILCLRRRSRRSRAGGSAKVVH